ncbi:MAG: toprim domain-containing protein, partial [Acidithiobacillus sp.]
MGAGSLEQGHTPRTRIDDPDRRAAREVDPTAYLEACGYEVIREGRHLRVNSDDGEVYRVTQQRDGHWVWCDHYGNHGGDNIELVQEIEPGTGYADAVYKLVGAPMAQPHTTQRTAPVRQPPQLPVQTHNAREVGRDDLMRRGISLDTIVHAEKAGMLRYADGAVLFVGYDRAGTAQNVTRRATDPSDEVQKRDLRGSDKSYPPILPGDPARVWIVEGGADALALHDIAKRKGELPPTVIVSGGANVRSFLEREHVQDILRRAERVTIAGENEKNPETQQRT